MRCCNSLYIVCSLLFTCNAFAQQPAFQRYDYSEIGLQFNLPAHWTQDGLSTTTKAAFIKQFGWVYDKPDANFIWSAVGSFSSVEVDSTLMPSDSAYAIHNFNIFVGRANTIYKKWLCRHHRLNVWQAKPLVKEGDILLDKNNIWPLHLPDGLPNAKGIMYEYVSRGSQLSTLGHVFSFVHETRCFELRLESTSSNLAGSKILHQDILNSVSLTPFQPAQ